MMKTLKLKAKDFTKVNNYLEYTGKEDVSNFNGNIIIEGDLGVVRFNSLRASGDIIAISSGIEVIKDIIGWRIKAQGKIHAGKNIKAGWGIEAGRGIKAGWGIEAGRGIKAGWGIEASNSIVAIQGIIAGKGIIAGCNIMAGEEINCNSTISCRLVFAGLADTDWKKLTKEKMTIQCGKLEKGKVYYGKLVELWI